MLAALPDLGLAGLFLLTWISPYAIKETMVADLVLVMLLEFFVVHSAGFMGITLYRAKTRIRRTLETVGLGLFYSLMVGAFAWGEGVLWPLWAFWGLVGNRLAGMLLEPPGSDEGVGAAAGAWVIGTIAYLFAVFATIALPLPRLGITDAVIAAQGFSAGGLWPEQPWVPLAAGVLHFGAQAFASYHGRTVQHFFTKVVPPPL